MKVIITIISAALMLASCRFGSPAKFEKPDIYKDTVAYQIKTIHERAADCGNKPDSSCTVFKLSYPVFEDMPMLNDTIAKRILATFSMNGETEKSVADMAPAFLKRYKDSRKSETRPGVFYTRDMYVRVTDQDSALVAIEYGGYNYEGGAHGATYTGFINWNPKVGQKITLNDILVDDYQDKLTRIADTIFRKNEKLKDTSSLARDYFFKDNKFALNDNYSINPLGIKFLYNQYEIKPYAAGQTVLMIPYDKLKSLIRPGSVISKFSKK